MPPLIEAFHGAARARLTGHGETDAFVAAAVLSDPSIDADQPAFGVHERAAGIAMVDGRIGLDEIFDNR